MSPNEINNIGWKSLKKPIVSSRQKCYCLFKWNLTISDFFYCQTPNNPTKLPVVFNTGSSDSNQCTVWISENRLTSILYVERKGFIICFINPFTKDLSSSPVTSWYNCNNIIVCEITLKTIISRRMPHRGVVVKVPHPDYIICSTYKSVEYFLL